LCCSNREAQQHQWLCYLSPKAKGLFGRHKAKLENAEPLLNALRAVLEETTEIVNICWSEEKYGP